MSWLHRLFGIPTADERRVVAIAVEAAYELHRREKQKQIEAAIALLRAA